MHIFHIHALIHHARLLVGSMRFLGTMLFMLFGLLGLDGAGTAPDVFDAQESSCITVGRSFQESMSGLRGESSRAADPGYDGTDGKDPAPATALPARPHQGVYDRLRPGIVLIPRMNRTPKPKSVYRLYARAPGEVHLLLCPDARPASSREMI